jgi:hypothetical protein
LFREARYLLAAETAGDLPLRPRRDRHREHHQRRHRRLHRARPDELSRPLTVLEDAALIVREPDLFRSGRAAYGIAEPLITFYEAIMRRRWPELELGLAEPAWRAAAHTFNAQVAGTHFEAVCRSFATLAGADLFGGLSAEIGHGTVNDPAERANQGGRGSLRRTRPRIKSSRWPNGRQRTSAFGMQPRNVSLSVYAARATIQDQ